MTQHRLALTSALGALLLLGTPGASGAQPTNGAESDWPCVQRLVPEIASGMIWAGPPLDQVTLPSDDPATATLAGELAARRVPLAAAEQQIDRFANGLPTAEKNQRLAQLFKRTLEIINQDRSSIIQGIKKFAHGQKALAEKINATNEEIQKLGPDQLVQRDTMIAERDWDVRIFDDRRSSLTYLCEQPVALEQRAFALARAIAGHME